MKLIASAAAALAASAVLAGGASAQTAPTMRLGGVGTITGVSAAQVAPAVTTLKYTAADQADTENVFFVRPYARGYYHGSSGFGYRPWVSAYRPYWRPFAFGFYRPWVYPRPYLYGAAYSFNFPVATTGFAVTSAVPAAFPSIPYYDAIPPAFGSLPAVQVGGAEALPVPRPIDTFRYDGGPMIPVPMPDSARPLPANRPAAPLGAAVVNRVATPPVKKTAYPAYGEQLPTPPRPVMGGPILVKYPGQK